MPIQKKAKPTTPTHPHNRERRIVCCFCGKAWGYAGEKPTPTIIKAAVDHEKDCPQNPYQAEIARLKAELKQRDTLENIFNGKWKGSYTIHWCHECNTAVISCPQYHNSSCNGSGCPECQTEFGTWHKECHVRAEQYLSPKDQAGYHKGITLQRLILASLGRGEHKIDFQATEKAGHLSAHDVKMFRPNLKGRRPNPHRSRAHVG